ncbi:D-tyrosyl-tRNA(Tyr) deacylase [Alkalithermobacter thermoalcaliphilus JW-YL-7 = DSM 7308]|uniref:D-aminoacyl-tRNA deacylase n=1 Tax=Alkalithermobacter thermoalcaliphilus JW-YL-7 = DSM 7308 TaxID=1121328 RepID=A0A150FP65_CLOPD|nr:D-tyrosyl-tRNA(Tyr) deacylase [[Clostridium] paradoxum JW-YL-7 = DSM 7308]SHK51860.1 D-tyrosyl-tRNA(Tyr) deacylase [[Clostridium] paradoxum JW-YL-7 = DSM 7308]
MRAVVQRVSNSKVTVDNEVVGQIGKGLMVLLGVTHSDNESDIKYLVDKILNLRIFEDEEGKMNLSLLDIKGELLVVSQFTLYGDCRKGRRPSFTEAAKPELANQLYEQFIKECKKYNIKVEQGKFGADMKVDILNDGPVTMLLDSSKNF